MKYICWDLWDTILNLFIVWIGSGDIARSPCHSLPLSGGQQSQKSVQAPSARRQSRSLPSLPSVLPLAPLPKVMQCTQHRGGEEGTQSRCQSPAGMNAAQEGPEGSVPASPQNRGLHLEPISLHIWIHLFSIEISLFSLRFSEQALICFPSLASPSYLYPPNAEIIDMRYHI